MTWGAYTTGVDRSCVFYGSGPTHFLRRIVYYCVCIQHDIDKSQISFIELCKTLRTNSGLKAINQDMYWIVRHTIYKACLSSLDIVLWQQNLQFSFHQQTVEFAPTQIFTQIYAPGIHTVQTRRRRVINSRSARLCSDFCGGCDAAACCR